MAYATVDELAQSLRIRLTPTNTDTLQKCLDAAAVEIDHEIDWVPVPAQPIAPGPDPVGGPLLNRVNIARGVEWFKANDAAFGVVGFDESGALTAPRNSFDRHANDLASLKQRWGIA